MPVLERTRQRDGEDLEDDEEDEDEEGLEADYSRANSPVGRQSSALRSRPSSQWGSRPGSGIRPTSGRPTSRIGSAVTRSRSLPRPPSSRLNTSYIVRFSLFFLIIMDFYHICLKVKTLILDRCLAFSFIKGICIIYDVRF